MNSRTRLLIAVFCTPIWWVSQEGHAIPEGPPGASAGDVAAVLKGLVSQVQPRPNTGTARYSVPIEVPPGRLGFQPSLSLNYVQGGSPSPYGEGWSLSIPRIERNTREGVPDYAASDFVAVLPGGSTELVPVSFVSYAARIEGAHAKAWLTTNQNWRLRDRSGMVYEFETRLGPNTATKAGTFAWYCTRIVDPNGNTITYSYQLEGGHLYPDKIYYGGNDVLPLIQIYRLDFEYSTRPTDQRRLSYTAGFRQEINRRLEKISVSNTWASQLVRRYEMGWSNSPANGDPLLSSVTVVGSDGTTGLPPTEFDYYPTYAWPGEVDIETEARTQSGILNVFGQEGQVPSGARCIVTGWADVNGDGRPDIVNAENQPWSVYLNQGPDAPQLFSAAQPWNGPDDCLIREFDQNPEAHTEALTNNALIDLNGDGVPEYIESKDPSSNDHWIVYFAKTSGGYGPGVPWTAPAWPGENRAYPIAYNVRAVSVGQDPTTQQPIIFPDWTATWMDTIDLNGDGRPDLIVQSGSNWNVYWNAGDGFNTTAHPISLPGRNDSIRGGEGGPYIRAFNIDYDIFDVNGDGIADRVQSQGTNDPESVCVGSSATHHWYVWYGKGANFESNAECWDSPPRNRIRKWKNTGESLFDVFDFNGDRLPDFVDATNHESDGKWHVYFNTGRGFSTTPNVSYTMPDPIRIESAIFGGPSIRLAQVLDLDGNGYPDLTATRFTAEQGATLIGDMDFVLVRPNRTRSDFLGKVTSPLGSHTRLHYTVSTQFDDHIFPDGNPGGGGPRWVVDEMATHDSVTGGSAGIQTYRYRGAAFDPLRREFLGFAESAASDDWHATERTFYHQADPIIGRPSKRVRYSKRFWLEPDGGLSRRLEERTFSYDCSGVDCSNANPDLHGRYYPVVDVTTFHEYGSALDWPWTTAPALEERTRTRFSYDDCGNADQKIVDEYDWSVPGWKTLQTLNRDYDSIAGGCDATLRICHGICDRLSMEETVSGLKTTYLNDPRGNRTHETRVGQGDPTIIRIYNNLGNLAIEQTRADAWM